MYINELIQSHSLVGLTGPNGCGKTTLLKQLKSENSGSVYMDQSPLQCHYQINVKELLWAFNIENLKEELESFGLEYILERKYHVLSGGEKQILKVLLSLHLSSSIVYLDEPTSFLDGSKKNILLDLIKSYSNKRKFVIVDHDLDFLNNLSSVVVSYEEAIND